MSYSAMWTPAVDEVLEAARVQARGEVAPEDLLRALFTSGRPEVRDEMEAAGLDSRLAAACPERVDEPGARQPGGYRSAARRVLELALQEGRREGAAELGVRHLLLGLVQVEESPASGFLREAGLSADELRRAGLPWPARIEEGSRLTVYEQVVAQIQEAIARGLLQPGDRLPPVRRLAALLDVAPGTVARAYRELERLGVVVTQGARGTRVASSARGRVPPEERHERLVDLMFPVVIAASRMGAGAGELRGALSAAMADIYGEPDPD